MRLMIVQNQLTIATHVLIGGLLAAFCFLATGCARLSYTTPPARLSESGPSIAVLPVCDSRVEKPGGSDLPAEVQQLIASELSSMGRFSQVVTVSNLPSEKVDYTLSTEIHLLEAGSNPPTRGQAIAAAAVGGLAGAAIAHGMMPVQGYAAMSFKLRSASGSEATFFYPDVISTNAPGNGGNKGTMMTKALQITMSHLKGDLEKKLIDTDARMKGEFNH